MNRGRRGETVFADEQDYKSFIALLQETSAMWKIRVAAYCLMSNHYHVLAQTPDGNLDRCMRHINGVYTQRYNRRHHKDGQLFKGRYKAILVDADHYLLELVRYIHRNPVRAGMAARVKDYPWSSHREYLSGRDSWVCSSFILSVLEKKKAAQRKSYISFVNKDDSEEITHFYSRKAQPSILGDEGFSAAIRKRYFRWRPHAEIPETKTLLPPIADIKETVANSYHVPSEALLTSRRGIVNEPRNIALYLARRCTGKKLEEIGREFNIDNYSTVSSAICSVRRQLKSNRPLQKRVDQIRNKMNKGQ
jgi:REP element-mobilizing transposase RayT